MTAAAGHHGMRAQLHGPFHGHGGMDTVFPRLVTAGSYHSSFVSSHQYRLPFEGRIIEYLDGNEEGVEIEMGDMVF